MIELTTGKKTGTELAKWFGISYGSFRNKKSEKLEELKLFAEFYEENGKVIITKVIEPIYQKGMASVKRKVIEKIDAVWSPDGLDSCQRVGEKILERLQEEDKGFNRAIGTIVKYTREGRNELYGIPFSENGGKIGSCVYIWCKRNPDTGEYDFLTEEEQEIKQKLQTKYFGDATEKQILVKAMVEAGEISKEDAWSVLEEMTNMNGKANFMGFLKEMQQTLHCQVIRGTLVNREVEKLDFVDNHEVK